MNQDNVNQGFLNEEQYEKRKLPSGLNVLTILTFIWCGISALLTICMPLINDLLLKLFDKMAAGKDFSAKEVADLDKWRAMVAITQQHMVPLMVVGLIGIALCFVGALWMRKLRKDGYWLYVAGEIAPVIAGIFIMGTTIDVSTIGEFVVPAVFVILYTLHRKYLVY